MTLPTDIEIIPGMPASAIKMVRKVELLAMRQPQVDVNVKHFLHAGVYARTCTLPPKVMITGALVKIPTILVINGDVTYIVGCDQAPRRLIGYHVLGAEPNRKQIFVAMAETTITMLFPSDAKTVRQAEEQFTDEWRLLTTRT